MIQTESADHIRNKIIKTLQSWVDGNSQHCDELGQCCPDYSCCVPELKQPKAVREAVFDTFLSNDREKALQFYTIFTELLKQKVISTTGDSKIYMAQNGRFKIHEPYKHKKG